MFGMFVKLNMSLEKKIKMFLLSGICYFGFVVELEVSFF